MKVSVWVEGGAGRFKKGLWFVRAHACAILFSSHLDYLGDDISLDA